MSNKLHIKEISDCFNDLPPEDCELLNNKKTRIKYLKGETIFKQGAFAPHVLVVMNGLAKIYYQTEGNKQLNVRLVQKGDFMALSHLFNNNNYQYSAVALKETDVCMIEKETLLQVLKRNPDFAVQLLSKNSTNELRYLEIIKNVSYKQMRGKLASTLYYLFLKQEEAKGKVFPHLTRQDIADFAAISVESTVKFLKEFEKEALLELKNKDIIIKDINKLRLLADKA